MDFHHDQSTQQSCTIANMSICDCEEAMYTFPFLKEYTPTFIFLSETNYFSEYGSDWASLFCATDYILDRLISETDINIAGKFSSMNLPVKQTFINLLGLIKPKHYYDVGHKGNTQLVKMA